MDLPTNIKRLSEEVINRIAAGEVIQRPANAIKELLENSLDAKSSNINVSVKNGGMKLLQIQDNGTGIHKDDFEIVCERFTTSKLREFEDLNSIQTYGFRGEALASISHIAHLKITSKTEADICAYVASYVDGKLQDKIKPVAGNRGTIITVEDLFYNMQVRKKALKSAAEEYQKISEVVTKYAIHNSKVSFSLAKQVDSIDIKTNSGSSPIDNIRLLYGNQIARELIEFSLENDTLKFKANGLFTNVNYSTKKFNFILFINNRLVDCQCLKKCIDQVYATYLPKNSHPFVYLSLEVDPKNVDVNVHPTKHEVHFLNEEQIAEAIVTALEAKLLGSNNSRVFYTQAKLPGVVSESSISVKQKTPDVKVNPKDFVRTDPRVQKLEKFFGNVTTDNEKIELNLKATIDDSHGNFVRSKTDSELTKSDLELPRNNSEPVEVKHELSKTDFVLIRNNDPIPTSKGRTLHKDDTVNKHNNTIDEKEIEKYKTENLKNSEKFEDDIMKESTFPEEKKSKTKETANSILSVKLKSETQLTSILELRKAIESNCHYALRESFAQHVFVGVIDPVRALIQYSTKLYLCNTQKIMQELFYQFIMYNFQNVNHITLTEPIPIYDLAMLGLDLEETGWTLEDGPKEELASKIVEILLENAEMLSDYFSLEIDKKANLVSLPLLIDKYLPDSTGLPLYLIRLATEVTWDSEKECFRTFAEETARFYSKLTEDSSVEGNDYKWIVEHIFYPAIKDYFIPPKTFTENAAILEIANLPNLYKVFERC